MIFSKNLPIGRLSCIFDFNRQVFYCLKCAASVAVLYFFYK